MYLAIVAAENGKISKYAEFQSQASADAHVQTYGGFVFDNTGGTPVRYINVDWANQTAAAMTQTEIDAENAAKEQERSAKEIDAADARLDTDRAFKAVATALWHVAKGTVPTQALVSPANYKTWLRSLM